MKPQQPLDEPIVGSVALQLEVKRRPVIADVALYTCMQCWEPKS